MANDFSDNEMEDDLDSEMDDVEVGFSVRTGRTDSGLFILASKSISRRSS